MNSVNPYLPFWEYIPDGEPYVFGDRVYVYGSHDYFGGNVYCMGDYMCWSAPKDDLGAWRCEGVIFRKDQDPDNADMQGNLYAPDVTVGPDGRYYLFYVLSNRGNVSVAVCDTPAGQYEYLGKVHYADGTLLGDAPGDEPQFDPGVLTEGDITYLYTGFCGIGDSSRHGAMATVLGSDMLTVVKTPVFVAPGSAYSAGTPYEGHAFFEAPSIRKMNGKYCFIYSSEKFHELCMAVSDDPLGGFEYKGVLISSCDAGISPKPVYYTANNHGSMVQIDDDWYIFYHRHTNGTNYSRQACFEKLTLGADGWPRQAEMTSCCSLDPLPGRGTYPANIVCNLFTETELTYVPWSGWTDDRFPKVTEWRCDGDEPFAFIANMRSGATAGFKYFDMHGARGIRIRTQGYAAGEILVRAAADGPVLGRIPVNYANVWQETEALFDMPDGVYPLYFTFEGSGHMQFASFTIL